VNASSRSLQPSIVVYLSVSGDTHTHHLHQRHQDPIDRSSGTTTDGSFSLETSHLVKTDQCAHYSLRANCRERKVKRLITRQQSRGALANREERKCFCASSRARQRSTIQPGAGTNATTTRVATTGTPKGKAKLGRIRALYSVRATTP
jgi:hypothetical protein